MQPALMTAVYALVLGTFLNAVPDPGDPSGIDTFAFFLLAGVLPWSLFAGGLGAAVGSVANAGGLITRVWFPRELLPLSSILALGFSMLIELSVLATAVSLFHQVFLLHLLPVLLLLVLLQVMFTAGFAFWLAACNVKFKDVEYLTSVVLLAYFYVTPILYAPVLIPNTPAFGTSLTWREIALMNPMARFVMAYRNVLYDVRLPGFETDALAGRLVGDGSLPRPAILRPARRSASLRRCDRDPRVPSTATADNSSLRSERPGPCSSPTSNSTSTVTSSKCWLPSRADRTWRPPRRSRRPPRGGPSRHIRRTCRRAASSQPRTPQHPGVRDQPRGGGKPAASSAR